MDSFRIDIAELVLSFVVFLFVSKRCLRYLRYFQQEEYTPTRFIDWIRDNRAYDKKGSIVSAVVLLNIFIVGYHSLLTSIVSLLLFAIFILEKDPRSHGKKKLVLTSRAKAIYYLATFEGLLFVALAFLGGGLSKFQTLFVIVQSPPFLLVIAVVLLAGKEKRVQEKLLAEAHEKFTRIDPYSIGITGSFGKTSVKNLLGDILSLSVGPTFWPQKGVNTEMGITREIRERMNDYDKFAVVEMGAYHVGSIQKLCNLTPIKAGLVTAVHFVHLERFGGVEEVYKAKSELAQNIPDDGILVVNGDNAGARKMATDFKKQTTLIYGMETSHGALDSVMKDMVTEVSGTKFTILWKEEKYEGFTKMHGRGALSNILGCFTMACALGAKPEMVLAVIRDINPVSNRLEVVRYKNFIQINDAYNSNPNGFLYALEVMRDLPGKRRILLTPGMIELGDRRFDENKKIAMQAAKICDEVIVVNETNKESLLSGLAEGGLAKDKTHYFATRNEALAYYQSSRQDEDILLLENDLPDLHEIDETF